MDKTPRRAATRELMRVRDTKDGNTRDTRTLRKPSWALINHKGGRRRTNTRRRIINDNNALLIRVLGAIVSAYRRGWCVISLELATLEKLLSIGRWAAILTRIQEVESSFGNRHDSLKHRRARLLCALNCPTELQLGLLFGRQNVPICIRPRGVNTTLVFWRLNLANLLPDSLENRVFQPMTRLTCC